MKTLTEHLTDLRTAAPLASPAIRVHAVNFRCGHQGDVYVHRISARPPAWNVETTQESRQVALGQSVGSRHCASGKVRVFWPESIESAMRECPISLDRFPNPALIREALGPIVESYDEWPLEHPEHAHHQFPASICLVTYQVDLRTGRRVVD